MIAELTRWAAQNLELTLKSEINVGSRLSEKRRLKRRITKCNTTRGEPNACAKEEANQSEWKTASCVEGDPCSSNWCKRYALWSRKIGFFLSFFPKIETWEFYSRSIHVQQSLSMLELLMAVPTTRCLKVDVSMFPRVASSPETASHASS